MKKFKIGTSGWVYKHWKNRFYPQNISQKEWLNYYSGIFSTVEINNTFYQLPSKETVTKWHQNTPNSFRFSVKASRYITHMKNLKDTDESLRNFLDTLTILKDKLGPILFQLPPQWHIDFKRLSNFIDLLPKGKDYAFEFRHPSWYDPKVLNLLYKNKCSLVIHDHKDGSSPIINTSDWVYVRFHGPEGKYKNKYPSPYLSRWIEQFSELDIKARSYFYFNNDAESFAIENAKEFRKMLKNS